MLTHIYRLYGADGDLLYVGQSKDVVSRLTQHRRTKPWWFRVAEIRLQAYLHPELVDRAEIEAIQSESPVYNVQHNRSRCTPNTYCTSGDPEHWARFHGYVPWSS